MNSMSFTYRYLFILTVFLGVQGCRVPPRYWCDSYSIAEECGVVAQCEKFSWRQDEVKNTAAKVHLAVYIESLCPDCKNFIRESLYPAWTKLATIMNLTIVPYGNAKEEKQNSSWVFTCQHGYEECVGNVIETCAIYQTENDEKKYFPFIYCLETSTGIPKDAAPKCSSDTGIHYDSLNHCYNGHVGNKLEHEMAMKTAALNPPHKYVPWVTLNGVHTEDIQKHAMTDLVGLICETYKGPKPPACNTQLQVTTRL